MVLCRAISSRIIRLRMYSSAFKEAAVEVHGNDISEHFKDPGVPKVAITKDKSTIVMYHPQSTISYEDTLPIPREDRRYSAHENIESLVREKLDELDITDKPLDLSSPENPWPMKDKETLPTIVRLANMFYTTKHVWFPINGKRSRTPPEDRPRD